MAHKLFYRNFSIRNFRATGRYQKSKRIFAHFRGFKFIKIEIVCAAREDNNACAKGCWRWCEMKGVEY